MLDNFPEYIANQAAMYPSILEELRQSQIYNRVKVSSILI